MYLSVLDRLETISEHPVETTSDAGSYKEEEMYKNKFNEHLDPGDEQNAQSIDSSHKDVDKSISTNIPKKLPKVMILILSYQKNFARRKRQREGWLRELPPNYSYKYIMGNPSSISWDSNEQREFFDIEMSENNDTVIALEVSESYRKIAFKVFWGFEWALQQTESYDYIVKTDDDIQPKVPMLIDIFEQRPVPDPFAYWGYVYDDKVPVRDPSSQWFLTREDYDSDEGFPPYACGAFYFLTPDLARLVVDQFRSPKFRVFPFEDIQMGIVVKSVGYKPQHNDDLYFCDWELSKDDQKELFVHGQ
jgi:RimJ/RimL family protein N-acetyltransferase